jgi:hypothetical protein
MHADPDALVALELAMFANPESHGAHLFIHRYFLIPSHAPLHSGSARVAGCGRFTPFFPPLQN